jgi:hypothetical protein
MKFQDFQDYQHYAISTDDPVSRACQSEIARPISSGASS